MKIRQLKGNERKDAYLISTFCFHVRVENEEEGAKKSLAANIEDWGAFDDDGTLMARILNNKYEFYVDGTPVSTGGIGAVSTLPEYRNTGAIKEIFKALLKKAYKNGEVISTLYPFNHEFYGKVGYRTATKMNTYEFKPDVLSKYRFNGTVKRYNPGEPVTDYLKLYNGFAKKFNLAAVRDEKMMEDHMKVEHLYKDRRFCYMFSEGNKNIGYILFTDVFDPEAAILDADEVVWNCREGFNAILAFIGRFTADYGKVRLNLPMGIDLLRIIDSKNAYGIEKHCQQDFMVRAVNAVGLLEAIDKPSDCSFTVKVSDDIITENNGIFSVTSSKVSVSKSKKKADIELNEGTLAQLCLGVLNLDEAYLKADVKINSNEDMLRKVFTEKKIFVGEHF